jgi:ABC-2 type transport system ATP-binding protein
VAEGTPAVLKSEVGASRLEVVIHEAGQHERARTVLAERGRLVEARQGITFCVQLAAGEMQLAPYVVALDQAGVTVDRIDLVEPSLDDVFLLKTGNYFPAEGKDDTNGSATPSDNPQGGRASGDLAAEETG